METTAAYKRLDDEKSVTKINKITIGLLIVTFIALIVVSIIAGINGAKLKNKDATKHYCTTTSCLELAAAISSTVNKSVDPCDDFYHYVCDGWDDDNSWINLDIPQYGEFLALYNREKEAFLDALFYNTKDELIGFESVEKASKYFSTCHDSDDSDYESQMAHAWIQIIIQETTFISNYTNQSEWDEQTIDAFHQSLVYLTALGYNPFFSLEPQSTLVPEFGQLQGLWQTISGLDDLNSTLNSIFVPLYTALLGVDDNTSLLIANEVLDFTVRLMNITTIDDPGYQSIDAYLDMITESSFQNLSQIFNEYSVMNYTRLVYDLWDIPNDVELDSFQYLSGGVPFFQDLGPFLEWESPLTVQLYVQFAVIFYYLNFQNGVTQARDITRTDFCFEKTKEEFPYVYGYILFKELYNDDKHKVASTLADEIKLDGTRTLIKKADWLDDASKAEAIKKIEYMQTFIGFPPRIGNGDDIDKYYHKLPNMTDDYMSNMIQMAVYGHTESNDIFWGNAYNLTHTWPDDFSDQQSFDAWLTGINAFYMPYGNWFTIPVTISQPPFFDGSEDYPSAVIYGALGWITGHEMSHGFDPDGSEYNYNGSHVGSIFTNYSQQLYMEKMYCFEDQYDSILIDFFNGTEFYDNGTRTITENVADNAGIISSWTAWRKYLKTHGNDKLLYGVDMSQEQLFFVSGARIWCESDVEGSNVGDNDVHSPNYARIIGAFQNMEPFAEAFHCKTGSRMNPKDKCSVW